MNQCGDNYCDRDGEWHRCGRPEGHRGAHTCEVDSHWVPSCADGCCEDHPETGRSWSNTPLLMALAEWSINKAEPGDVLLLDRQHPPHRAVEVLWNGERLVVVRQEGREVPYMHRDWDWFVLDCPRFHGAPA